MDISKPPDAEGLKNFSGLWQWLVFFGGLVFSGGAIEYWMSRRYVTKAELKMYQDNCQKNILNQLEIALLKNNERLEERMVDAVSNAVKESLK